MALDSATTAFLTQMAEAGGPPLHEMSPQEARTLSDGFIELCGPGPEMARVDDITVPGADGHEVPVRVLVPTGDARGVIVYLHGGGWVVGSLDGYDTLGRQSPNAPVAPSPSSTTAWPPSICSPPPPTTPGPRCSGSRRTGPPTRPRTPR